MMEHFQQIRLLEAILFASAEPLRAADLAKFLPDGANVGELLEELAGLYANRGVNLMRAGDRWAFRSAADLGDLMRLEKPVKRRLSRAAIETLAIVAYHQPVTRAEIEEIRGVGLSRGTLDTLLEMGWIKPRGRRRTPGRPVTWGTTDAFLDHFGLESLDSLPGQEELKAAGLLDTRPAITSLAARGLLPPGGAEGEAVEGDDEEELSAEEAASLLDAEFGEDLLPAEHDAATTEANGEDDDDDEEDEDDEADEDDDALVVESAEQAEPGRVGAHAEAEEPEEPDDPLEAAADRPECPDEDAGAGGDGGEGVFSRVAAPHAGDGS
ncbi:MAG: SMC-Scp complex subunit ScpB [Kiloniellales bacterium]